MPTVELIGDDRVLWATDFSHLDGVYPGAVITLAETLAPLPAQAQARTTTDNAIAAYGISI